MSKNKRLNPIEKAKANPKSRLFAMNAHCFECSGDQYKEVTHCLVKECSLWPFRPWQNNETSNTGGN